MDYLKNPLDVSDMLRGRQKRFPLEASIAQQIMLLIVSHPGEVVGKEHFGSIIWELEFNQLVKVRDWEEKVRESLINTINLYEKRLKDVDVQVDLSEIEDEITYKSPSIRRQASISVHAIIKDTDEPFFFNTTVYISPLSR